MKVIDTCANKFDGNSSEFDSIFAECVEKTILIAREKKTDS